MKQYKIILTILMLFLVAALIRSQASGKAQVSDKGPAPSASVKKSWHIVGWGLDEKQAVEHALNKAADQVWNYLRKQDPDFVWKPSPEYVRDHLLAQNDFPNTSREPEKDYTIMEKGKEEKWEAWSLTVHLTPAALDEMKRINQQLVLTGKQAERMTLAGKIVGLLVAGCVLALTYLRLEEKTKGYYSHFLLFSMAASLILIGAALFLFI